MYYFFSGNDTETSARKARELVESLRKKRPDATLVELDDENFSRDRLTELVRGQGLFVEKCVVYLNRVRENKEHVEILAEKLPLIAASQNIFVIREGALDKKTETTFSKRAEKHQKHDISIKKSERFNTFALADALGARDRKMLWRLYAEAKHAGISDEEIHGLLFWQIKSMRAAGKSKSAEEAGLKPFVFGKAKRYSANFARNELAALSSEIIRLYHDSRRGLRDFPSALEQFVLKI